MMKTRYHLLALTALLVVSCRSEAPDLQLSDLGYFERQGGAVRLSTTPEQWDLVPTLTSRTVDTLARSIEVGLRYDPYDFDSRVTVTARGKAVEIAVYLNDPVPDVLTGEAGFNLEFLPSQYWNKAYLVDGKPERLPRYAVSDTKVRPNAEKVRQFKGYRTYDDRGTGAFVEPLPISAGHEFLLAPGASGDGPLRPALAGPLDRYEVQGPGTHSRPERGRLFRRRRHHGRPALRPASETL